MKRKVLILILTVLLLVASMTSIVKATNESEVMPIDAENIALPTQVLNGNSFNFTENIEKSGEIVNGNMFLAGNIITVKDETINGDLFIFGNMVTIEENVNIHGNLYICAINAKIDAKIDRCVYAATQDIIFQENSTVGYESYVFSEHFLINGTFNRNIYATAEILEVGENANVLQTLNFTSSQDAKINENAKVNDIKFEKYVQQKESLISVVERYVLNFARYFILTMILFIIFIKFTPKFLEKMDKCFGVSSFGIGILSLLIVPAIVILLISIKFASSLAFAMLALFLFFILISTSVTSISIASLIARKTKKIKLPILVALITILSWVIFQIPFLGGILSFFMLASGIGVIFKYLVIKK